MGEIGLQCDHSRLLEPVQEHDELGRHLGPSLSMGALPTSATRQHRTVNGRKATYNVFVTPSHHEPFAEEEKEGKISIVRWASIPHNTVVVSSWIFSW